MDTEKVPLMPQLWNIGLDRESELDIAGAERHQDKLHIWKRAINALYKLSYNVLYFWEVDLRVYAASSIC